MRAGSRGILQLHSKGLGTFVASNYASGRPLAPGWNLCPTQVHRAMRRISARELYGRIQSQVRGDTARKAQPDGN